MNKQIFKKCKTLGEYHEMTQPYVISVKEYSEFYKQHKEMIDAEGIIYSTVSNDRKKMGGSERIHKITKDGHTHTHEHS